MWNLHLDVLFLNSHLGLDFYYDMFVSKVILGTGDSIKFNMGCYKSLVVNEMAWDERHTSSGF